MDSNSVSNDESNTPLVASETNDEVICRYCFGSTEEGELVSPCKCKGGQKYVHLYCLRRWQRMVLVTQPTHPAFYRDDIRQRQCNVCGSPFDGVPAPTRHELMQSFTGAELAAMLSENFIIGSNEVYDVQLERHIVDMTPELREETSYAHWIHGVFLIVYLGKFEAVKLPITSQRQLQAIAARTTADGVVSVDMRGTTYRAYLDETCSDPINFNNLVAPINLYLRPEIPDCGNDQLIAVNLARQIAEPIDRFIVNEATSKIYRLYPAAQNVEIFHFKGGPCDDDKITACLVIGGSSCGWKCVPSLEKAIMIAYSRSISIAEGQGDIVPGQTVQLKDLQARPELNGEIGIALTYIQDIGRWAVRLRNGDGKQVKPSNLTGLDGKNGRVFVFWGDARWTRTQLLGEIARGHWGLCKASVCDIHAPSSSRWTGLQGRLAFAPETEMTDQSMRRAQRDMIRLRNVQVAAVVEDASNYNDDVVIPESDTL